MREIDEIYWPVIDLAKSVGAYQKQEFRRGNLNISQKSSEVDLVTRVDLQCDQMIVEALKRLFPEDGFLAEESGSSQGANGPEGTLTSGYTWIIDPLDGTTNFSVGLPIFAVSIARYWGDEPVFGVVYVPMVDDLFVAQSGRGAYMNGLACVASSKSVLRESVLATGFPYDRATARNCNAENIARVVPLVKGVRRMGAAAYDLCLVAAGVFDGFWELRLAPWDFAAARLMILEAGGVFNFTTQGQLSNVVCGSRDLVNTLEALVDMTN